MPNPVPQLPRYDPRAAVRPAGYGELVQRQLAAIDAWYAQSAAPVEDADPVALTDAVRERVGAVVVERSGLQLLGSGDPLRWPLPGRAVLVLQDEALLARVSDSVVARGVDVIARLGNGADALGVAVAEQPDLLLTGDGLALLDGTDLASAVRRFSPGTRVLACVEDDAGIPALLEAGAAAACTRRMTPEGVAGCLVALLTS